MHQFNPCWIKVFILFLDYWRVMCVWDRHWYLWVWTERIHGAVDHILVERKSELKSLDWIKTVKKQKRGLSLLHTLSASMMNL